MKMVKPTYYTLVDRKPVPTDDVLEWASARLAGGDSYRVQSTRVGEWFVSTFFIGIGFVPTDLMFETVVFRARDDVKIESRTLTWEEAEEAHARILADVVAEYWGLNPEWNGVVESDLYPPGC